MARAPSPKRKRPDLDDWDASDPIRHTELLAGDPKKLRVHRARVIRMAKAAIKSNAKPVLISFNVEALAWEIITETDTLAGGLELFFDEAAKRIKAGLTNDPARVDGNVAVAVGSTTYVTEPGGAVDRVYDNCFVLRFDADGRCREFTEWYVERPQPG